MHSVAVHQVSSYVLSDWTYEDLTAPYWRLYRVDRPGGIIGLKQGRVLPLQPKHIYLIAPNTFFSASNNQTFAQLFVHFNCQPEIDRGKAEDVYELRDNGDWESCLNAVWQANACTHPYAVSALLTAALLRLPFEIFMQPHNDPRIAKVCEYVLNHLHECLDNAKLAKLAHLHVASFSRLFRSQLGCAPQAWVMRQRLDRACGLLHHSSESIELIASKTGFCDRSYFSYVFKKERGISPGAYRRQVA